MIAVIFELQPNDGQRQAYLDTAATLSQELQGMDGFMGVERFESLLHPGKLLSLSFWRDEEAVRGWRGPEHHRQAQAAGRAQLFADYRLRVAEVLRDYGLHDRAQAPADSRDFHTTRPPGCPTGKTHPGEELLELPARHEGL